MASPQNASLGKYTNDFREGDAGSTLGTQGCIHTHTHSKMIKFTQI